MSSKNWKSLLFVSALSLLAAACGHDEEKAPDSNPYSGLWASKSALGIYRTYKTDINAFCARVYRAYDQGDRLRLNPHIVQANGEVFTYDATMSMTQVGYREVNYQGIVNQDGLFLKGSFSFQSYGERRPSVIQDRAVFTFSGDATRSVLTVYWNRRNVYFVRTEPNEMNNFLAMRQTCEDSYQKASDDSASRAEEARESRDEAPGFQESEWDDEIK